jgi:hypothetical protein
MSIRIYVIVMALVLMNFHSHATVKTLNNNHPSPGQYSSWASIPLVANDTIYVSGSPQSYGDIAIVTPNITLIGTGFHPNKQAPAVSQLSNVSIGSEGCKLIGLKFNNLIDIDTSRNVITVRNCWFNEFQTDNQHGGDYTIEGNVFNMVKLNSNPYIAPINKFLFQQNFLFGYFDGTFSAGMNNSLVKNNVFINMNSSVQTLIIASTLNTVFVNNIFVNIWPGVPNGISSSISFINNCSTIYASTNYYPPSDSTNIMADPLFVNYPCINSPCGFNPTHDFHLQTTSPCKGTGYAGEDMGLYGNMSLFTMTGEPNIPQIRQMNLPATVIKGQTFNVDLISTNK